MKKHILRTLILSALALIIGGGIAFLQIQMAAQSQNATVKNNGVAGAPIGGEFTLVNHNGETVTQDILKGHYTLIYFGFTFCPAICPTELQKISGALATAPPEKADKILPVFITIDPDRDTVDVMKNYVAQFHPRIIGLTGTQAQITQTQKAWHVYAQKIQDETMNDYTMDHSSYIYLQAPDGTLMDIFGVDTNVADLVQSIEKNIP